MASWTLSIRTVVSGAAVLLAMGVGAQARAEPLCDRYAEQMSPADIQRFQEDLVQLAPVQHIQLAHRIRIRNVEDPMDPAPYHDTSEDVPTIYVPAGFRRLQCRLIQLGLHSLTPGVTSRPFAPAMAECVNAGHDPLACIRAVIGILIDHSENQTPFTDDTREYLWGHVDVSFQYLLLHEFAHIALNHVGDPGEEAEADTFASLRQIMAGQSPLGVYWTHSVMALTDPYLEDAGGAHGRFACRASILNDVLAELLNPTGVIVTWLTGTRDKYISERSHWASRRMGRLPLFGDSRGCPTADARQLQRIAIDLDAILARLDNFTRNDPDPVQVVEQLNQLMALDLATDEARALRMVVVSLRLRETLRTGEAAENRALSLLERVMQPQTAALMASEDYGRLHGSRAILGYQRGLTEANFDRRTRALQSELRQAIYFHPRSGALHLWAARAEFSLGNCEAGRNHVVRLLELAPEDNEMRTYLTPLSRQMTRQECAAAAQRFRQSAAEAELG